MDSDAHHTTAGHTEAHLTVGQLASRTGLSVKAVRYYSDLGLLPEAERTTGGHRRFPPAALERIGLIRQLRELGMPIAAVTRAITGESSLADLVADELHSVQAALAQLRWREATLRALDDCPAELRLHRLALLARVQRIPRAHTDLAANWARALPRSVPTRLTEAVCAHTVPEPPADPTPESAVAYAELLDLAAHPGFPYHLRALSVRDKASLYAQLLDASRMAAETLTRGGSPATEPEVDLFAGACARGRGEQDEPGFRVALGVELRGAAALLRRYAHHLGTVTGDRLNVAATHCTLIDALAQPGRGRR